ncbi:hypothetical protein [Abyssisolibacter fermentans]|uniref:hypothetical protein n=1 Tax=Abyssisolibacter fermentans TaxID=1766203 RepID=UPI0008331B65|nr:hypothetical protein [Abyssisolibacter fermentans]
MTKEELMKFEEFILDSFSNDIMNRELRLSLEEKEYLEKMYSRVIIEEMDEYKSGEKKEWYKVSFPSL